MWCECGRPAVAWATGRSVVDPVLLCEEHRAEAEALLPGTIQVHELPAPIQTNVGGTYARDARRRPAARVG
jgi:hypothetical protein